MTERLTRCITKAARCRRPAPSAMLAGLLALCVAHPPVQAAQAPTEDSLWYYEIGGAEPVSKPANPEVVSVTLGGAVELGLGYSCG